MQHAFGICSQQIYSCVTKYFCLIWLVTLAYAQTAKRTSKKSLTISNSKFYPHISIFHSACSFISPKQHILIKCGQDTSRQNLTQSILATDSILVQLVYFQHKPASGLRPRFLDSVSSSILKPVFLKITDILSYLLLLWILSEKPCNKSYCTDPLYAISFHKLLLCWLIVNAYDFC